MITMAEVSGGHVIPPGQFADVVRGVQSDAAEEARRLSAQPASLTDMLSMAYLMGGAINSINVRLRLVSAPAEQPLTFAAIVSRQRSTLFWTFVQHFAATAAEISGSERGAI